jgi:ATP-dependent DNA ligase
LHGFDMLAIDGADTRRERLDDRRAKLRSLLARPDGIRFSEHLAGRLSDVRARALSSSRNMRLAELIFDGPASAE